MTLPSIHGDNRSPPLVASLAKPKKHKAKPESQMIERDLHSFQHSPRSVTNKSPRSETRVEFNRHSERIYNLESIVEEL